MKKKILSVIAVGALAFGLTGCSGGGGGADTTCSQFKSMNSSDQKEVVKTILKDKGQSTDGFSVAGMQLAAGAYCAFSSGSATLRGLDG